MDIYTLKYLIDCKIFTTQNYTKSLRQTISHKEIMMSTLILKNNWNIGSFMKRYENVDFTLKYPNIPQENNDLFIGDVMRPRHESKIWDRYELVFIKGNR